MEKLAGSVETKDQALALVAHTALEAFPEYRTSRDAYEYVAADVFRELFEGSWADLTTFWADLCVQVDRGEAPVAQARREIGLMAAVANMKAGRPTRVFR